jgi:ABC-type dipeptide/oligopeptide/nickel transport system permease subunit
MKKPPNLRLIASGTLLSVIVLVAVFAPWLAGRDPRDARPDDQLLPPSGDYFFGTDRDVFSRVSAGSARWHPVDAGNAILPGLLIKVAGGRTLA